MKKNISINISGIIFHIEEDGYEILRKYLDSINKYFSSYEDSSEILADIESRVAEIFLAKLNEGKQVITAEDVNSLVATMGSVSDFKAAETEFESEEPKKDFKFKSEPKASSPSKKLYRDQQRKILGGVCSGLAHYFNIDPVWIRLLFALLILGSYGGLLLVYIILWIVLPGSDTLEEEASLKKMYRDQENKVVGGVASGVAAFFGADITLIRVLFVILTFVGGLGFITYLILWIALPEAKTITEKMRMQGEPVTLSNIESTVKKNINEKEGEEESTIAKIILFPFRVIAAILKWIAKVIGPIFNVLVDVFRVGIGIVMTLFGICLMISIVFAGGIALGLFSFGSLPFWFGANEVNLPLEAMRSSFPSWTIFFGFIVALIPALFITLIGNSIIAKRIIFNAAFGWSMFVLFFVSLVILGFSIPQIAFNFKEEGEYKVENTYVIAGTPTIRINEIGMDDYDVTSINIKGHGEPDIKAIQRFEANGTSRKAAIENAQMVSYTIAQKDSILIFDSNITFLDDAQFRAQRLDVDVMIPYDKPFIIEEGMWHIIDNYERYQYSDYRDNQTWKMTEDDGLVCMTCPVREKNENNNGVRDEYGFTNFNQIELKGIFDVRIVQSDFYGVEIEGSSQSKKRYDINQMGETLIIEFNDRNEFFWKNNILEEDEVKISISLPSLTELDVIGAGTMRVRGFDEEDMEIKMMGAMKADCEFDARNLIVDMTGATVMDLKGEGNFLEADITGASSLRAYSFRVEQGRIEAHGASSAKVNVSERLEINKGVASKVSHRGDPEIIRYD